MPPADLGEIPFGLILIAPTNAGKTAEGLVFLTAADPALGKEVITLLVDDSNLALPGIFESAVDAGVRITSVEIQEPNLEAVFLHLTGRALRD